MSMNLPPIPPAQLNYALPAAPNNLRVIAIRQRAVMYCLLAYIVLIVVYFVVPVPMKIVPALGILAASVTAAVFVFMLALATYNTATGIILGILTLVPLVGMIVLLAINQKATSILRRNGIKVGLMGADPKQIPQ
jgi:hypothetical protein